MKIKTKTIAVEDIKLDKEQPRKEFDEEKIKLLAQSIEKQGLINPIEVDEHNKVVTGEMRFRALKKAGIKKTEVKELSEMTDFQRSARQLIENFHRQDLKASECVDTIQKLWKVYTEENKSKGPTIDAFANEIGIGKNYCGDLLDLKDATPELKKALKDETLNVSQAVEIRASKSPEVEKEIVSEITKDQKSGFNPTHRMVRDIVKSKNLQSEIKNIDMKELNKPKLSDFLPQFQKVVDKIEFEVGIANTALQAYSVFRKKFDFSKGDLMRLRVACKILRKTINTFAGTLDKIEGEIEDE